MTVKLSKTAPSICVVNEVFALSPVHFICGGCGGYEHRVISFVDLQGVHRRQL